MPDAPSPERLAWGVIGPGRIAARFAEDLPGSGGGEIVAVASRSQPRAAEFARRFWVGRLHVGYESLFEDSEVEAVYIAVPHSLHHEVALAALQAGKHVLLEKPFTLDVAQSEDLVRTARAQRCFLMEAMWSAFLPHTRAAIELVESGAIGEVSMVRAEFARRTLAAPTSRLLELALGGGALLDVGVYPLWLATAVLGRPARVEAAASFASTGADATTAILLQYPSGASALLGASFEVTMANAATIAGTAGRIEIAGPFYAPSSFSLVGDDGDTRSFSPEASGFGLGYEAAEVARCVRAGRLESDVMPLSRTLEVMATLDEVRHAIGLVYPCERARP